ncbi:MAG: alpha/beta hydrolase [Rhizobiaceae bacterium]
MSASAYPEKYNTIIDEETWAFIAQTNAWYPPETMNNTVEEQRLIYNKMCRAFFTGYPAGVNAIDSLIIKDDREIPIRTYSLVGSTPKAQVVYYHGGGFVVGGLDSHDDVCAEICGRTGFVVTSIDYRLAPEHRYPADFNDAVEGFQFCAERSQLPVLLVGDSAGGNLAAAVAHATRGNALKPIGQVLIYPGLSSDMTEGSFIEHARAPLLTTEETMFYKSKRSGGDEKLLLEPNCSPLNHADFNNLPPSVIVSAECDPLSDNGRDYRARIIESGGKAIWYNEAGLVHGFLRGRHSSLRIKTAFTRIIEAISALGDNHWPHEE